MSGSAWRELAMVLFRMKGVPVKLGWSWLVIFLLVFWSLASALFPTTCPGLPDWCYLVMAAVATLLFFASILVHELCHTLRSLREGVPVHDITLFLFGGVSRAEKPLPGPGAEFRVVLAGPLASAALAIVFWALAAGGRALDLSAAWTAVPDYLARINALLLAFNLVPALPLDGGRLLHALLWRRSGDRAAATVRAAGLGQAFALALVAFGVLTILTTPGFGGIWFAIIGWFLFDAAGQERLAALAARDLSGLRARDLMATTLVTVDPEMTIEEFAEFLIRHPSHPTYPVLDHGRLVGLLLLDRAGAVPLERRGSVRVADVMLTGDGVPFLRADDLVVDKVEVLNGAPGRAVVLDDAAGDDLVGLLSVTDLARAARTARRG